jgi:hypothetical protein
MAKVQREWDSGRLLTCPWGQGTQFPLRIPLKYPTPCELGEQFGKAGNWSLELTAHSKAGKGKYYSLETREVNHRQLGKNVIPVAAVFENETEALLFIRKNKEAEIYRKLCMEIVSTFPEFADWLSNKPFSVLAHADEWPNLLSVIKWIKNNPQPAIYIRQIELAGVDTKFMEKHKKLFCELLDITLRPGEINESAKGVSGFEKRFGFLIKPPQVRFRILDRHMYLRGLSDIQIPAGEFSALNIPAEIIFITENEVNGLAFPEYPGGLVIFGLGYGLDVLAGAGLLRDKNIYYWGDIDTHGFAMLDQIRSYFPQTRSFLMDRETLMDHQSLWGKEDSPVTRDLRRLNETEKALYDDLRSNRIAILLRMEQERISFTHLKAALERIKIK